MPNTKYKIQNTRYNSGFTIVELIITTAVVIVLASTGFLSILSYKNNQGVSSEAEKIVAALRGAQNNSLSQEAGNRWGVYFENTTSSGAFYVIFSGSAYSATTTYVKNVLPSNIKFDLPARGASSSVVFAPITGLPNSALTVQITLISNPDVSRKIAVDANGVIDANLVATYTITASAGSGGSISPSGSVSVRAGDSKSFTMSPSADYANSSTTVDGVNQGAIDSYTFTNVQANHAISASFATAYIITASAGSGGSISPSGSVSVLAGNSRSFTISSNAGYAVSSVLVDSVNQGAISSYNFTNVQTTHTILATFKASTIDPVYRYAWNDFINWIDFGYPSGNVNAGLNQLTGYAYNSNILQIALDCATSPAGNVCASSNFKVNKNSSTGDLSGYAWNDSIGWISFNCSDLGICASSNYKVNVNSSTGAFTGYAWNDSIGWISLNCSDMGVCGSSNYRVNVVI